MNLTQRPRRLRRSGFLRDLVAEHSVRCEDFITPLLSSKGRGWRARFRPCRATSSEASI